MKLFEAIKMRWVVWVWNHTPNCAEMSGLVSRSLEKPVTLKMRFRMRLHFLICAWCQRYQKHLKFLHHAAPRLDGHAGALAVRGLPEEARQRIARRLQMAREKL